LVLRPIEHSDLLQIQKWRNDKDVLPYVREYRLMSMHHIEKWYKEMIASDRFEMFMLDAGCQSVGIGGLTYINWQNRHADLHFAIYKNREWVDKEYAPHFYEMITSYAFNELNLNKVYVEIYSNDLKKIDFFENKGFHRDAVLRQHYFHEGRYFDSYILSLLTDEWKKAHE